MKRYAQRTLPILTAALGLVGGYALAMHQSQSASVEARQESYTDRGRICLEAAAKLRKGEPEAALHYLEERALGAIRGVPMGRGYSEMPPKSQTLLVTARRYDDTFDDVDLEVDRLTRGDVPRDHADLSDTVRAITSPIDG